jgi:hypothetical protein
MRRNGGVDKCVFRFSCLTSFRASGTDCVLLSSESDENTCSDECAGDLDSGDTDGCPASSCSNDCSRDCCPDDAFNKRASVA